MFLFTISIKIPVITFITCESNTYVYSFFVVLVLHNIYLFKLLNPAGSTGLAYLE